MKDPAFQKDREELWGRPWTKHEQEKLRPAVLANLRANFDFLESILADGRDWVLGTSEGPKLADIHACWIFDWLFPLLGAFPEDFFNKERYPKTMAWRDRYNAAIAAAKEKAPKPTELEAPEAVAQILKAGLSDDGFKIEPDPSGLAEGQEVEMYPIDTVYSRRDSGNLVDLTASEAVVSTLSQQYGKEIRFHYSRWNFTIASVLKAEMNGDAGGEQ